MYERQDEDHFPFDNSYSINCYYDQQILQNLQESYNYIPEKNRATKQSQEFQESPNHKQEDIMNVFQNQNYQIQRSRKIIQVSYQKLKKNSLCKTKSKFSCNFARDLKIQTRKFLKILHITNQLNEKESKALKQFEVSNGAIQDFAKIFKNIKIKRKTFSFLKTTNFIKEFLTSEMKQVDKKLLFLKSLSQMDTFFQNKPQNSYNNPEKIYQNEE